MVPLPSEPGPAESSPDGSSPAEPGRTEPDRAALDRELRDEPGPDGSSSAEPSDNLPPVELSRNLVPLYTEAVAIAELSPASACALLRLLLRTLIAATGLRPRHLVRDIEKLVSEGAPMGLMRTLDVLKLSDNEARRPGEINLTNGHREAQNLMLVIHLFAKHVSGGQPPKNSETPKNSEPDDIAHS